MERLTRRTIDGEADCAYCNGDCTPDGKGCSPDCELWNKQMEKLASYEEAEEQGLLLRLPCRVGNTVWVIEHFKYDGTLRNPPQITETKFNHYLLDFVGKTVFLTRAEAEKALEEMEESKV